MLATSEVSITSSFSVPPYMPRSHQGNISSPCARVHLISPHAASMMPGSTNPEHNSCLSINDLPIEILSNVFSILKSSSRSTTWMKLAQVCYHWRSIVLSSPLLWIDVSPDRGLPSMCAALERSSDVPIHFESRHYVENLGNLQSLILPHMWRTRTFKLTALSASAAGIIITWLARPMPALQDLTLHTLLGRQKSVSSQIMLDHSLYPDLRTLSLKGIAVTVAPSSDAFGLLHLQLSDAFTTRKSPDDSIAALIEMLRRCPFLESVVISERLPTALGKNKLATRVSSSVLLPRVKSFRIHADANMVSVLLTTLALPACARLEIKCQCNAADIAAAPLHHVFGTEQLPSTLLVARSLYVFITGNVFRIRALDSPSTIPDKSLDLEIESNSPTDMSSLLPGALRELARMYSSAPIEYLQVHGDQSTIGPADWRDILGCLPELRRLEVGSRGTARSLFCGLSSELWQDGCANLRQISLNGIRVDTDTAEAMLTSLNNRASQVGKLERVSIGRKASAGMELIPHAVIDSMKTVVERFDYK